MKLLTRNADYGVRAICYMACKDGVLVSIPELVKKLGIPRPFLRKILQLLGKKRLVSSCKGIGGGFRLAVSPSKLKIMDVVRAFQGPFKINECLLKKKICPNRKKCVLRERIGRIERHVIDELNSIRIADLIR